jgi:lipopolysaccharide heptosyltransferase II
MSESILVKEPPATILLIKLGAIGDLVMVSAFMETLRKTYPRARVTLLTGRSCAFVHEHNPCVDERVVVDDGKIYRGKLGERLRETWRMLGLMRRGFDRVYVLHRAWQFNALAFLAAIPDRVGYARGGEGAGLTLKVVPQPGRNEREIYLDLLRAHGVRADHAGTRYYLSPEEDRFLAGFLVEHGIADAECVVGFGPGGGDNVKSHMPTRRWPVENFARLARVLADEGRRVLIFGGPKDAELAKEIRTAVPSCVDATPLSVGRMASVFRRCRLYVGNDSGPLHIADAMGVPTLGLFGPTDPRVQAPLSAGHTTIYKKVACSPCFDNGKFPDCSHIECLRTIAVEEVLAHARTAL